MGRNSVKFDVFAPASALAVFTVVTNALLLVMPIYMTQVYDRILPTRSTETLIYLSAMAAIALALFGLVETVRQTLARKLAARYEMRILPSIINATSDREAPIDPQVAFKVSVLKRFLSSSTYINLFDLPFAPLFLLLMFLVHPLLGAVTAGGMVVLSLVAWLNEWCSRQSAQQAASRQSVATRYAQEALNAHEDLRAMGMAPAMVMRWMKSALLAADAADTAGSVQARFYGLSRFVRQVLQMGTLGIGAWLVIHDSMSASLIFASSIVSARALMPIEQLVGASKIISEAQNARRDVNSILRRIEGNPPEKIDLPAAQGHLSAHNLVVSLEAAADMPVILDHVSVAFVPGQLSVIVGPSGSGKSTLVRLLCGASMPASGEVRLDGFRLSEWPAHARGQAFGYIPQQIMLLEGTVAQNIARFDPQATDSSIVEASRRAQAHEFISTLPQGYNTRVGPGGVRLSGGQIQRIALARALYTKPAVLVLDEPNSNLDSAGEDALMNVLVAEKTAGTTIVVVTHRSSLLGIANTIYLMDKGKLRAVNTAHGQTTPKGSLVSMASATSSAEIS